MFLNSKAKALLRLVYLEAKALLRLITLEAKALLRLITLVSETLYPNGSPSGTLIRSNVHVSGVISRAQQCVRHQSVLGGVYLG